MFQIGTEAVALLRAQRLNALYRIIPRREVKWALAQGGRRRRCPRLPDVFVVYFVLAMGLFCCDCYRQVFRWLRAWKSGAVPGRSTLCEARRRLGLIPLVKLAGKIVRLLAGPDTRGAMYRGLRLMAIDGFVVDVADSKENERVFGMPQGGRTPGAFPQARIVALCEAGTHVLWRWLIKPIRVNEQKMADYLLGRLQAGMLLMWDRGFLSYRRVARVIERQGHLLAKVKKDLVLKPISRLSDKSYLAKLYRNSHDRKRDRNGIVVRVLDYELNDPSRRRPPRAASPDHHAVGRPAGSGRDADRAVSRALGTGTGHRRTENPSGPARAAQPDARGGGSGVVRVAAGSLRGADADVRGGTGGAGAAAVDVVHRHPEDPALPNSQLPAETHGLGPVVAESGARGGRGGVADATESNKPRVIKRKMSKWPKNGRITANIRSRNTDLSIQSCLLVERYCV